MLHERRQARRKQRADVDQQQRRADQVQRPQQGCACVNNRGEGG